ncbi:hypothetical protein BO068_004650 [Escherichia coli]|nr:hypothetical protein [Salmonella enterica subsp. enterica]EBV3600130.1 hypothetical protein [Salmonella enterica subsp. enterica serovar Virchow]EBW1603959.1 hypothetical protein [Salmonella enterica subsp. enterica serovar Kottbus]EBW2353201.1 hypothetical protein [Salmonella enterica subsp. enterica serovar Enteritidis]EFF2235301.1 hypothetical protein [Escherichia coli]
MAQNNSHPWLDPLWRRVLLIGACAVWTAFELYNGDKFWTAMVGIVTVYGAYSYLYDYTPSTAKKPDAES